MHCYDHHVVSMILMGHLHISEKTTLSFVFPPACTPIMPLLLHPTPDRGAGATRARNVPFARPWPHVPLPRPSPALHLRLRPLLRHLRVRGFGNKSGNGFGRVFFLMSISLGSPQLLGAHVARTCGKPTAIEWTAAHALLNGSLQVRGNEQ